MRATPVWRSLVAVALLAIVLVPVASAARTQDEKWDPAVEWRSYPRQLNPSPDHNGTPGVWAYMGSTSGVHDPATYYLLPTYQATSADSWLQVWQDPDAGYLHVSRVRNTSVKGFTPSNGMHPGYAGQMSIIAWTSPLGGTVAISGTAKLVDAECIAVGSGIVWSIDRGAETLLESVVPSGGETTFAISASVEVGETLYFVLAPGENDMCDTTFVRMRITSRN